MNPRISIVSLCLAAALVLSGCGALHLGVETPIPRLGRRGDSRATDGLAGGAHTTTGQC